MLRATVESDRLRYVSWSLSSAASTTSSSLTSRSASSSRRSVPFGGSGLDRRTWNSRSVAAPARDVESAAFSTRSGPGVMTIGSSGRETSISDPPAVTVATAAQHAVWANVGSVRPVRVRIAQRPLTTAAAIPARATSTTTPPNAPSALSETAASAAAAASSVALSESAVSITASTSSSPVIRWYVVPMEKAEMSTMIASPLVSTCSFVGDEAAVTNPADV
mmetsp:Transcript_33652/g.83838  ORF Transcript_33652/g.83838 Transcript_33652/m.83838 type:complete len:221 (+) Transcript_33652:1872-2534(+)